MATNDPVSVAEPESEHRTSERPWNGESKIVLGIHIGTTHSGATFTFLTRGCKPILHRVTRWPGQEAVSSEPKVPSVVWYDRDRKPTRIGAEALTPEAEDQAEDNGWQLAKHFILHLHPDDFKVRFKLKLDCLPAGVPLRQIYSDLLRYLFQHTQRSFETDLINGKEIWRNYQQNMDIVIGHPNGYGIREQAFLRSAAISAGIVTSENATRHIQFVSEGEALIHFCLHRADLKTPLPMRTNVALCNAGDSTVDTSIYNVQGIAPAFQLQEVHASACVQAGALFVNVAAESYLRRLFVNAGLDDEDVDDFVRMGTTDFEYDAKRVFHEVNESYLVQIGASRYTRPDLRVRRGKLTLEGSTIQSFFDPCVDEIIASINSQISSTPVSHILLTGSFGDSPYLSKQLRNQFEPMGTQVISVSDAGTRAVADGAVLWHHASQLLTEAVSRCAYGTEIDVPFDQINAEHCGRAQLGKLSGTHVNGKWFPLVPKGVSIKYDDIRRQTYTQEYSGPDVDLGNLNEELYVYYLDDTPGWLKNKSGKLLNGFLRVCSVTADLRGMRKALQPRINACGAQYWALMFNVCFLVGGAELNAYIEWVEEGAIRTMPANLIYYNLLL